MKAPCFANSTALARPMPEPAPVTIAVRPASLMSGFPSMPGPPAAQIGGGIAAAEPRPPAELLWQARDRKRRSVDRTMQVDRRRFTGISQPANEAGMLGGQFLTPLQRRPLHAGRNVIELVLRVRSLDQQCHGFRDIHG